MSSRRPKSRVALSADAFQIAVAAVRSGGEDLDVAARRIVDGLTDKELLSLLHGEIIPRQLMSIPTKMKAGAIGAGVIDRIGFPGVQFLDGPRGIHARTSTAFPVTMARGATWDTELETRVGAAIGLEGRAIGGNYSGAVCINLLRHPAWGRAQECYGEDPVLTGKMGAALTSGIRTNMIPCVKHFALNSMENARFRVDVRVDEHALHEVYLPHFKTVIDAGADSVMSAYNSVNGKYAGENRPLLTEILREEWGFQGFVTSDWVFGVHDGVESLTAGCDIEMPAGLYRNTQIPKALKGGRLNWGRRARRRPADRSHRAQALRRTRYRGPFY